VVVLGRRGPAQAAFTNPELLELPELTEADVFVDPKDVELDEHSRLAIEGEGEITHRRNVEILTDYSQREPTGKGHRISLKFLRSPVEILGEGEDGPVTGIRIVRNRLEPDADGRLRAVPTGEEEVIPCGLVLRSIGYRGRPVGDVPFDERRGLIRNDGGRVCDEEGVPHPGEYVAGWIKRGPSGVIGTNKKDAADTVAKIVADAEAGALNEPADADPDACAAWLLERVPDAVTWEGWQSIDAQERAAGEPHGRPRVKLMRLDELIEASRSGSAVGR
jgi:ferredoxin--NADP+ reductase